MDLFVALSTVSAVAIYLLFYTAVILGMIKLVKWFTRGTKKTANRAFKN